jgi:hypothetical protein
MTAHDTEPACPFQQIGHMEGEMARRGYQAGD